MSGGQERSSQRPTAGERPQNGGTGGRESISQRHGWRARAALLTLGAFVVSTDGYIIVGLLPEIRSTLQISTAEAGQLVL